MPKSERAQFATVQTAWINYQEKYLGVAENKISTTPPQQFQDIFWQGHAYGMMEERRKTKVKK